MLPTTEEVVLHRVKLRGTAVDIDDTRAPLKTALEQTSWPTTAPGELLFLRKITASGNPRELAARAAEQARRLADNAVDGGSPAAANAMAVRFRTHSDLIATLIRDLLLGTAGHRWYWQRWHNVLQRPADEAIVTLLEEEPLHLPAVLDQLRQTPVWQPFWRTLGGAGGERLLTTVARAGGWSATVQAARVLLAKGNVAAAQTNTARETQALNLAFLSAHADDPRTLLAALITLWQRAPALLIQTAGAMQLCHLAQTVAGKPSHISAPIRQNSTHGAATKRPPTTVIGPSSPDEVKRNPGTIVLDSTAPHPYNSAIQSANAEQTQSESSSPDEVERNPDSSAPDSATFHAGYSAAPDVTSPYSDSVTHDFITPQGGLLYLLNFLNLPTVRAQLPADMPGAGWRWLHDLATALGGPPEGELLEFLAAECGLENGAELARQPLLIDMEPLVRLGAGRYGDEAWQDSTWQIPARIIANASHIDLHFRLDDARLAVRRVGLDVNPGWLPWLGRVVTFHYGSGLEPAR